MTTKEKVIKAVRGLPADASIEDAMERLLFLAKIEKGLQQADAGQTLSHEQVKEKMAKWLKQGLRLSQLWERPADVWRGEGPSFDPITSAFPTLGTNGKTRNWKNLETSSLLWYDYETGI